MSRSLVHRPRTAELAPRVPVHPNGRPVAVYLSSLSSSSVPAMKSGLNKIAILVDHECVAETLPWHGLRFAHTAAIVPRLKERYAPRTVNRMISSIRGVLKASWKLGQMSTDDYHRAIEMKIQKVDGLAPAGRVVPSEEISQILRAAAAQPEPRCWRDQAMVVMLYAGGLRRQEVAAISVDDYSPKTGVVTVQKGKGGKYREVPLAEGYRSWILPWWGHRDDVCNMTHDDERALFPRWTRSGRETNHRLTGAGVDHALNAIRELARVEAFTPHDLRRSYATELLDAGADLLMVQALMGHADVKTTKIYDRRGEAGKRKAAEKFPVVLTYEDFKKGRRT